VTPIFSSSSFSLSGKRAFVAGGSKGIGGAAAEALASAGAHVTVSARGEADLSAVCKRIRAIGGTADFVCLDVTHSTAVQNFFEHHEAFDILINSAGSNRPKLLVETPDSDIDEILALNLKAAFYLTREFAKRAIAADRPGSIVHVSSQMGHVGGAKRSLYCASKHGLEGMTKALSWELGPYGIRVNTLSPTFIETEMTAPFLSEPGFRDDVISKIALGRLGTLQDIVGAVVFLASDASSLMTGTTLKLDGGWTAV
jgi:NAD(P)-dependent dehydrogenase (short-subunit alcohol dehydrogenase family)